MEAPVATWLAGRAPIKAKLGAARRHRVCYDVGMRFGWRSVVVGIAVAFAVACTSPTLPLPPPGAPSESAGTTVGTVVLHGGVNAAQPNAIILVKNDNPALTNAQKVTATEANADGTWDATVFAVKNDVLHISQIIGNDESPSIDFTVLVN